MAINQRSPKHWAKLFLRPEYREYCQREKELERLNNAPRYTPLSTSIFGKPMSLVDGKSFYYSYREICEDKIYNFSSNRANPFIVDCGSNVVLVFYTLKGFIQKVKL